MNNLIMSKFKLQHRDVKLNDKSISFLQNSYGYIHLEMLLEIFLTTKYLLEAFLTTNNYSSLSFLLCVC